MYIWVEDLTEDIIQQHSTNIEPLYFGRGRGRYCFIHEYAGFDIETTSVHTSEYHHAYMYIWSFTFNDLTILGSYWEEVLTLFDTFKKVFELNEKRRMMVFIANTSFEFQFMRKWLNVTSSFFTEERKPLYIVHDEVIEIRDALQISGGNLETLARNYTKTQKMVGDLDYTIPRNHNDARNLSEKELQYVINDTVILSEYMEYYFRTFSGSGKLPLTKTGILRNEVQKTAKAACKKIKSKLQNIIAALHPHKRLYELMMKYLFRGGYVHGTIASAGQIYHNLGGIDLTSSYPAHMNLFDNYPVSKFIKIDYDLDQEEFEQLCSDYAVMAVITFYDIENITAHSLESINKVIEKEGCHLDNGRVMEARRLRVFLTELDYDLYKKFYKWTELKIEHVWYAKRGRLPRYLLEPLNKYYIIKSKLKREGKQKTTEYSLAKEMVNAGYGLTVTRMRQTKVIYNNFTDEYEIDESFVFESEVEKQALLPQWGIWVTANARHTLMDTVYQIDQNSEKKYQNEPYSNDCYYMDTDSIKLSNYNKHKHIIENHNKKMDKLVHEMCEKYNYNYEDFRGLGSWDLEYSYIKNFKHNGAKRYLIKYYDFKDKIYKTESTIAGLPKGALLKYAHKKHISVWSLFTNYMDIPVDESGKLAAVYNDEEHSDIVNGQRMYEKSSVCLVPIGFTMSIDKDYAALFEEIERRIKEKYL